jgi:hypothetical protein
MWSIFLNFCEYAVIVCIHISWKFEAKRLQDKKVMVKVVFVRILLHAKGSILGPLQVREQEWYLLIKNTTFHPSIHSLMNRWSRRTSHQRQKNCNTELNFIFTFPKMIQKVPAPRGPWFVHTFSFLNYLPFSHKSSQ